MNTPMKSEGTQPRAQGATLVPAGPATCRIVLREKPRRSGRKVPSLSRRPPESIKASFSCPCPQPPHPQHITPCTFCAPINCRIFCFLWVSTCTPIFVFCPIHLTFLLVAKSGLRGAQFTSHFSGQEELPGRRLVILRPPQTADPGEPIGGLGGKAASSLGPANN